MIRVNPLVEEAIRNNQPIVGLESTIISHGMPYPDNIKTSLLCEDYIKNEGAIPATIAIINGEIVVGLTEKEIEFIANPINKIVKVGRKDLPVVLANKANGALTVSATMMICDMVNIRFFATGGIGGVHRGVEETFDISQDLREFTLSNVVVVSAGVKSILDINKTLEYLETLGVLVIGFKTKEFPAFYTQESNIEIEYRCDSPDEIAEIIKYQDAMKIKSGILIANPIPKEYSYSKSSIDKAIEKAMVEMKGQEVTGKAVTPYLLAKISEITANKSLEVNQQLVYNNCRLAAQIAKAYQKVGGYGEKN